MQSRRSGEPHSAISRTSFDDRERLIFPGDDEEANTGFGLSDLTEDSDEEEEGKPPPKITNGNGHINGNGNGNGILRTNGVQEYQEVPQKMNGTPLR